MGCGPFEEFRGTSAIGSCPYMSSNFFASNLKVAPVSSGMCMCGIVILLNAMMICS